MTDPVGYSIPLWAVFCRECKDEEAPDDADAVPIDHADAAREGERFMVCECCERVYDEKAGEWRSAHI